MVENAAHVGAYMLDRLRAMQSRHPTVGDVRGKGLMLAIELVVDKGTKERAPELRNRVVRACYGRGMLILGCGANNVRFSPPLLVDKGDVDEALAIFEEALTACEEA